jgi:hypothetical protein
MQKNLVCVKTGGYGEWWMVNGEWWMVKVRLSWCRCWSFDQQPKLTVSLPVANSILFQRFACWSKDQHGLKWWMVNGEWWMVNGEWWMVNGEWSIVNCELWIVNGQSWILRFVTFGKGYLAFPNCKKPIAYSPHYPFTSLPLHHWPLTIDHSPHCPFTIAPSPLTIDHCPFTISVKMALDVYYYPR